MINYGEWNDLKKKLGFHSIIRWSNQELVLENGCKLTIECSQSDGQATAYGHFYDVKTSAPSVRITGLQKSVIEVIKEVNKTTHHITVSITMNGSAIAKANIYAESENEASYSTGSIVLTRPFGSKTHYPVVSI